MHNFEDESHAPKQVVTFNRYVMSGKTEENKMYQLRETCLHH